MRFQPGQSGNPTGRPAITKAIRELAREHTVLAVDTLVEIAKDKKHDPRARVAAANSLLDRGYGKPSQSIELDVKTPVAVKIETPLTSKE